MIRYLFFLTLFFIASFVSAQQQEEDLFEKFKAFMQMQEKTNSTPAQQNQDDLFEKFKLFLKLQEMDNESKNKVTNESLQKKEANNSDEKTNSLVLTDEQKENFKKEAANAIEDLMGLINKIGDPQYSNQERNDAINSAVALFLDESKTVEVTSIKTPNAKAYHKIRAYLNRIKMVVYNYKSVKYTAYDIGFASDFKKGTDGNYYAEATFCQLFQAKTKTSSTEYDRNQEFNIRDVTCKRVTIILERVEVLGNVEFILKLGDIYVEDYGRS
ncbi:MAG: hypothetical protein M9887_01995 [Chitinophagales bacterium]|nr:hypothetical protein [Chitinophagales bacterium]